MSELEQPSAVEEPDTDASTSEPLTTRTARGIRDFVDRIADSSPARLAGDRLAKSMSASAMISLPTWSLPERIWAPR